VTRFDEMSMSTLMLIGTARGVEVSTLMLINSG
jgi:hypothetical protein